MKSRWQTEELAKTFLEGVRGAIPFSAAQIEVILRILRAWRPDLKNAIDLGCGDGILGRAVLKEFPDAHVLFMDFSDPMLEATRRKIASDPRAEVIKADFSSRDWRTAVAGRRDFGLIVSGLSIHHQPDERKRTLYSEIFELLSPGGIFLNLEHVSPPTPAVEGLFDECMVDGLFAFHRQSRPDITRREVEQSFHNRPDKRENILAPLELQCRWLSEIGFQDVDCFFKIFDLALLGGRHS